MNLHEILIRSPINRTARVVTSQRNVSDDRALDKQELVHLKARLLRKHSLLKVVLCIKSNAQLENMRYARNRRIDSRRIAKNGRAAHELFRVGEAIQKIDKELALLKEARRVAYASKEAAS